MINTNPLSTVIPALPNDVIGNIIFSHLSLPALGICSRVCKAWNKLAMEHMDAFSHERAFGPKEWFIYFGGYLKNTPRLSPNMTEILNSPCPFVDGKKVHETHLLVLVPQTVNGQPLTFKTLGELVQKPLQGHATNYSYFYLGVYTDPAAPPSHWVLMTRDVIEGSRNKRYQTQQALLSQKGQGFYRVPTIIDATVCIFMEYVRTATRLYSDSPWTFARCQEKYSADCQLGVGGFGAGGLNISHDGADDMFIGVGGSRKL